MDKLAKYVHEELNRIAFFIAYAGVIEEHFPRNTKKILLELPIKWDDQYILIHGKKPNETTEADYFYSIGSRKKLPIDILIKGEIKDRPFTFKIVFGDNAHRYYLDFEDGASYGHKKPIRSMGKIKDIISNIDSSGEEHDDKDMGEMYQTLFKGKAKYDKLKDNILAKFFGEYKHLNWKMTPMKDPNVGVIYLKLFATDSTSEEYKKVFQMLTETDPERARFKVTDLLKNKIPNYVGSFIQDAGFEADPSVKGVMRPKLDEEGNLSGKLGFTITLE